MAFHYDDAMPLILIRHIITPLIAAIRFRDYFLRRFLSPHYIIFFLPRYAIYALFDAAMLFDASHYADDCYA